ncbi:HTH_38 domain-containing protein [Trichonephila clavipes]|nr:HTH_38 domain-containing protein [Trichonephila clavipes]
MENNICNSLILTSRRRYFYLVGQSKHNVGDCGVNNQASAVLAGNELPFVAFSLREAGWSNRRIGRHLGRSDMVVARCWQQWITEGRVYRRGGSGRPRNTNDREDRAIRRVATSAPTTSLASIQRHLPPSRHPVPSRETIRRRLTEVGVRSRRPLRRLPLTPHHRQCRLDFADLGKQLECDRLETCHLQ